MLSRLTPSLLLRAVRGVSLIQIELEIVGRAAIYTVNFTTNYSILSSE